MSFESMVIPPPKKKQKMEIELVPFDSIVLGLVAEAPWAATIHWSR